MVFLLGAMLLGLSSCEVDLPCNGCDLNDPGLILPISAGPIAACLDASYPINSQWVIRDENSYQSVANQLQFSPTDCDSLELAAIDFSQHSVLSMAAEASGCEQYFCPRVEALPEDKQYRFTIVVKECGGCEPLIIQRFWVVVPRLPDGYTVDFVVQRE